MTKEEINILENALPLSEARPPPTFYYLVRIPEHTKSGNAQNFIYSRPFLVPF